MESIYGVEHKAWSIKSSEPKSNHSIKIYTNVEQAATIDQWRSNLEQLESEKISDKKAWSSTLQWWQEFWDTSWLVINPDDERAAPEAWEIARNYQIFRYQLGCNYYGDYPTKFNGGNFTVDPDVTMLKAVPRKKSFTYGKTADWRAWGGGSFTAQNQRLLYWPMLKTGDFEAMLPQFEFYIRSLPTTIARTERYWGHKGCSFTEQMEDFGLPIAAGWGWTEPEAKNRARQAEDEFGVMTNKAIKWHYTSQLEISFMILEYFRYTGEDISRYMDLIKNSIYFYDEHYRMRHKSTSGKELDNNGKLVIFPSTACEGYKGSTNPVDVVAGLKACVGRLLTLPSIYISDSDRAYFREFEERIPDIYYNEVDGEKRATPAEVIAGKQNAESPQYYPLFPFNIYELERDDEMIDVYKSTYKEDGLSKNIWSWNQSGIFCARIGLESDAKEYNVAKLSNSEQRFPTFWGPGHDWVPDHNWGGSGMIGLQEMLMQCSNDKILLFPTWPKEWSVNFKLRAPENTTIEGILENGEIKKLNITPKSREKDVVIML